MAQILVVAVRADQSAAMTLLKGSGHDVVFAPGFEPAIKKLDQIAPDLLITDVRLGGFNGLHLVIRSQSTRPKMRSILLDRVHDPVIAADAERHGAAYIGGPVTAATLAEQVSRCSTRAGRSGDGRGSSRSRAWCSTSRADRRASSTSATAASVSSCRQPESIPAKFRMAIPGFEGVFRAKPVWSHYTPRGIDLLRRRAPGSQSADRRAVATARGLDPRRRLKSGPAKAGHYDHSNPM